MQIPNISLAYLVAELKPIVDGSVLRKVQELENNWLKLKLQTRQGTKDLIAAPDALFLTAYSLPAKQQTSGFGAFLRKKLSNKRIASIEQHGLDRILVLKFEEFSLIFELFAKGNVVLVDGEMNIVSAYRKETWKDRTLKKGYPYKFPSSKGTSPLSLNPKQLKKAFEESNLDTVRTLVREANIAPIFAEETCQKASIPKERPAKSLNQKELSSLTEAAKQLYTVKPGQKPAIAEKEGQKILLPFPTKAAGQTQESFQTANQAIDAAYTGNYQTGTQPEKKHKKQAEFGKSMQRQQQALKELQQKAEENALKAELIYENYTSLFEMQQELKKAIGQNQTKKDVMYKMAGRFPFLKEISLKNRKAIVSLQKQQ